MLLIKLQVTHDASKGGYGDCLAIALGTGHYAKQCHAFQAKSSREVRRYGHKLEGVDTSKKDIFSIKDMHNTSEGRWFVLGG